MKRERISADEILGREDATQAILTTYERMLVVFFRALAEDAEARRALHVRLTPGACREVARVLEAGIEYSGPPKPAGKRRTE